MELKIPKCLLNPTLKQIQSSFNSVIQNVVEASYGVSTWGKNAKTIERKKLRPLKDEIIQERTIFKVISEHKDTIRGVQSFTGGLMLLKPDIDELLTKTYNTHKYLWASDRDEQIQSFVDTNPLTADIREMFVKYDRITENLLNLPKSVVIGPIYIQTTRAIADLVAKSKEWKVILGHKLSSTYKKRLKEIVDFISEKEKVLSRNLRDLDDVRMAMNCLISVRENFIT